ncbi:MAG: FKBP-type peptidyl-prolyl cis-trans isomerase [Bacteroidales bacterium]|nr:FKBP-type peptidyl-prolyl cis-trans isomerase [Bacteroidales bacterium]
MKKSTITAILSTAAFALLSVACAKEADEEKNASSKRYFDAWMSVNEGKTFNVLYRTAKGAYIIEEEEGTGETLIYDSEDTCYVFVDYTEYDLEGNVKNNTRKVVSQQNGDYVETNFYGPTVWLRGPDYIYAGIDDVFEGMKVGGRRKAIIPGWLLAYGDYDTEEEYIKNCTGDDRIYDITLAGTCSNITTWELDSLERYVNKNMDAIDSTAYGIYCQTLIEPTDTTTLPTDTTVYINYVGKLLNGQIFDTNIKKVAIDAGIFSSSTTYEPTLVTLSEDYTDYTMGDDENSMIDGFAYAISQMHEYEKIRCVFYSGRGYSYSGSGNKIPAYSPLMFEIELVDAPED